VTSPRRRRWRDYATPGGTRPVRDFIDDLDEDDATQVLAAMKDVSVNGLEAARHVRGDIYEVRAPVANATIRILFSVEGTRSLILLALEAFAKTSRETPPQRIRLAESRLASWRARGHHN
jgi:phage-related protein